jgi:hypothetical protein
VADTIVKRSPLQFDHVPEQTYDGAASPGNGAGGPGKTFTVEIFPAPEYDHKTRITLSPLRGPWPEQRGLSAEDSFAAAALRHTVPKDMSSKGLRDWDRESQFEHSEAQLLSTPSKLDFIQQRKMRKLTRSTAIGLMTTADATKDPSASSQENEATGREARLPKGK